MEGEGESMIVIDLGTYISSHFRINILLEKLHAIYIMKNNSLKLLYTS